MYFCLQSICPFIRKSTGMKYFLCLLITFACIGPLAAQEGLHIGFYAGPQNSRILNQENMVPGRTALESTSIWSFNAMGKIGYNIGPPFGFHLGVIYSQQGGVQSSVDTLLGRRITNEQSLTYIKIPLYLHFNSDPAPAMFTFEVGPQIGLLQSASIVDDGVEAVVTGGTDQLYKPNDLAFAWSIGAEFALTEWVHVAVTHRGDYSILDIENKDFMVGNQPFFENSRGKANNLTLSFQAGLIFCVAPGGGGRNNKYWIR